MATHCTVVAAQDIADRTRGRIEGDRSRMIGGEETIDKAAPDMLTWVGSPACAA
jgi:hypothetical protein